MKKNKDSNTIGSGMSHNLGLRNRFSDLISSAGSEIQHPYFWVADLRDGGTILDRNPDGSKNLFALVLEEEKKDNLKAVHLIPKKEGKQSFSVILDGDKRIIYCVRGGLDAIHGKRYPPLFLLGWQRTLEVGGEKRNVKSIYYIDADGNALLTDKPLLSYPEFVQELQKHKEKRASNKA